MVDNQYLIPLLIFAIIGALKVLSFILSFLHELIIITFGSFNPTKYGHNYWACITGASDGIGLGFVEVLASKGVNIIMVVRNKEKAEKAIQALSAKYPNVQYRIVLMDFVNTSEQEYKRLQQELSKYEIGILVNNAGVSYPDAIADATYSELTQTIEVNCFPVVLMTKILVPQMRNRNQRSAIINIASFGGTMPIPYMAVYSASKAFDDFFSRAIQQELKDQFDVMSLRPMYVTTQMTFQQKGMGFITNVQCALGGLNRLGWVSATNGYIVHRIQSYFIHILPSILLTPIITKESKIACDNFKEARKQQERLK